ncbi:hypothetical protein DFH06DRAFT_560143 [Mycena polygramma]|nr:hypothetical protein DFH06DRAFT_560143 [Mycena polygramma]
MGPGPAPFFPLELEREIFEMAAHLHPETMARLLLVAQRVHEWIARIRYRIATPDGTHFTLSTLALTRAIQTNSHPPSFFRDRVRHLGLPFRLDRDFRNILSTCSEIQTIFCATSIDPMFQSDLNTMRPSRLSIYLIFDDVDYYPALFTFVTHLNVMLSTSRRPWRHADDVANWQRFFALLPALTHLSLYLEAQEFSVVPSVLALCANISMLVARHPRPPTLNKELHLLFDDDRLVNVLLPNLACEEDWITGAKGGMDFWACAEAFIAKKRRGEIEPSSRCWIEQVDGLGSQYCV